MPEPKDIVAEYFVRVDRNDIDWVLAQFEPNAVYERDRTNIYDGIAAIEHFFRVVRPKGARHIVDGTWQDGNAAFAAGVIQLERPDDTTLVLRFGDLWIFNDAGSVIRRQSYLVK